jgi:hypothetical protein
MKILGPTKIFSKYFLSGTGYMMGMPGEESRSTPTWSTAPVITARKGSDSRGDP